MKYHSPVVQRWGHKQARSQGRVGAVGRSPPPPLPPPPELKSHFSANFLSANIMNIICPWNKINKMHLIYHVDLSFDHKVMSSIINILQVEVSRRQPLKTPIFKHWKRVQHLRKMASCYQKVGYRPDKDT